MILRFLEIALLVAILWRLIVRDVVAGLRTPPAAGTNPPNPPDPPLVPPPPPETLVRCAHCGVLVPASRAWRAPAAQDPSYCSRRCLAAAP